MLTAMSVKVWANKKVDIHQVRALPYLEGFKFQGMLCMSAVLLFYQSIRSTLATLKYTDPVSTIA